MDVEITELEKIDADRVDGVGAPASGIPILLMKAVADPVAKDWAAWDAAHEGGSGKPAGGKGDSKADAADAVARAKQTIADHKAGKPVSAADLKNAHEVHEAHLAHEAKLKAEADAKAKDKPAAKKAAAEPGARDCPECGKGHDADHKGNSCEDCGAKLPAASDAAKALVRAIIAKAVDGDGQVDEAPDVEGGTRALAMIADLIIGEAQELKAGQAGEIRDIQQLACAAEMIWCWRTGEESVAAGSVMPATALMQSAAKAAALEKLGLNLDPAGWPPEEIELFKARIEEVFKSKHSAADRKKLAEAGNALSDGSYPIADEHDLKSAAILAQSGHGDVEGAKRLIGRRAKELGVKNPLDDDKGDDASKAAIAKDGGTVDTVVKGTGDLAKVVEDAVAKALQPYKERVDTLTAELAKVKAAPVPGGPVLSRNVQVKQPGGVANTDWAAKAAYYREMAETVTDRPTADGYRKLAREADEKAVTPPAS